MARRYCEKHKQMVVYLDCLECETKCKTKQNGGDNIYTRYLVVLPKQEIYMVFASKKEGYTDNIILLAKVKSANFVAEGEREILSYTAEIIKCVNKKDVDITKYIKSFTFHNTNIDTGIRVTSGTNFYPVFTTKEKCLEWLKK